MGNNSSRLRRNRTIYAFIAAAMIVVFVGSLFFLKNIYQTQTYYVLNQSVSPNEQITPKMLSAVTTSAGTAPRQYPAGPNLGLAQVQTGNVYSVNSINAGELVTESNTSNGLTNIAAGVPDSWVVTSFSVPANQAMDRQISKGNYFDMMIVTSQGSFYPFYNMLCLNATVDLSSVNTANAVNTSAAHAGQTSEYFIGLPPAKAAQLQYIMSKYGGDVYLVLSPVQNEYAAPKASTYNGIFTYIPGAKPSNAGIGTDNTFSPVKRGNNGKPVVGSGTINTEPSSSKSPDSTYYNGASGGSGLSLNGSSNNSGFTPSSNGTSSSTGTSNQGNTSGNSSGSSTGTSTGTTTGTSTNGKNSSTHTK